MGIIWTIIIGFVAGIIAKFLMPGDNEPSGFIMTTLLGVVGAFVASYLGQAMGWYSMYEGAGLIGAVVGASCGQNRNSRQIFSNLPATRQQQGAYGPRHNSPASRCCSLLRH